MTDPSNLDSSILPIQINADKKEVEDRVNSEKSVREKENRIYFSGLNEIRAIAAFAVFVHHVEQLKGLQGLPNAFKNSVVHALGAWGVSLFFVLSGFLITYLLLQEQEKTNTINIKFFYIRRTLRIWPVYFLVLFISLAILPGLAQLHFFENQKSINALINTVDVKTVLPLFIFFLSNVALAVRPAVFGASQNWSVSVEEQFYAFWPWVIRCFHKHIGYFLVGFIIVKLLLNKLLWLLCNHIPGGEHNYLSVIRDVFIACSFELMAIGGLGAFLIKNERTKHIIRRVTSRKFSLPIAAILLFSTLLIHMHYLVQGIVFVLVILTCVFSHFSFKLGDQLGKISYGTYMYHSIAIYIVMAVLYNMGLPYSLVYNSLLYFGAFSLVLVMSHLSFKYYETPILKLKRKFEIIKSGNSR